MPQCKCDEIKELGQSGAEGQDLMEMRSGARAAGLCQQQEQAREVSGAAAEGPRPHGLGSWMRN